MSNIIKKNPQDVQEYKENWGLLADTNDGMKVICSIGQPTSQTGVRGSFNFKGVEWPATPELKNLVIIYPGRSRILYGKGFSAKRRCGSDNWHVPSQSISNPVSPVCSECPLGLWDSALDEEGKIFKRRFEEELGKMKAAKPLCHDSFDLFMVDDRMTPFKLAFQKTQIKVVTTQLINKIKYKGKKPLEVIFDMTLKECKGPSGIWFEPVFSELRENTEKEKYQDLWDFYHDFGVQIMSDMHRDMDKEKEAMPINEDAEPFNGEPPF